MNALDSIICAIAVFNKKVEEMPTGGVKLHLEGRDLKAKYTDILASLKELEKELENNRLVKVRHCYGCENFNRSGGGSGEIGWCFLQPFKLTRNAKDFCSLHKRRSKKQDE